MGREHIPNTQSQKKQKTSLQLEEIASDVLSYQINQSSSYESRLEFKKHVSLSKMKTGKNENRMKDIFPLRHCRCGEMILR